MFVSAQVTQPSGGNNIQKIAELAKEGGVTHLDVAVAYATAGGAHILLRTLKDAFQSEWSKLEKRWLTSFDYCRTEPLALELFEAESASNVRIHDGKKILASRCVPRVPFHPKTFILRGPSRRVVLAGSGNLSRSGLTRGHEVGLVLNCSGTSKAHEKTVWSAVKGIESWFDAVWNKATPLSGVQSDYRIIYDSIDNRAAPVPTDDDSLIETPRAGSLTPLQLRQLRVCSHLWVEAQTLTKNRGPLLPGNQLMLKRMTRVFFGIPAVDVSKDTHLGDIKISFAGKSAADCTISFSNNSMDKITLPVPGTLGPAKYDDEFLLFKRIQPGTYQLQIGTSADVKSWKSRSAAIGGIHVMKGSGRAWGVF